MKCFIRDSANCPMCREGCGLGQPGQQCTRSGYDIITLVTKATDKRFSMTAHVHRKCRFFVEGNCILKKYRPEPWGNACPDYDLKPELKGVFK